MTDGIIDATIADPQRVESVRKTKLLDTATEESFDRLTRLAAKLTGAPVTFISLVGQDRDFYKSCFGLPEPLASERVLTGTTFCHYALVSKGPLVIPDTEADPVYRQVPTVKSLGVKAYLGVPLITSAGTALGSFCAVDFKPRAWSPLDVEILQELAASTLREIELRSAIEAGRATEEKLDAERRLLDATVRQMPGGLIVATADGKILLSNALAHQILGREIADLHDEQSRGAARPDGTLYRPEEWPLARAIRNGEIITAEEISFHRPDGEHAIISVNAAPIRDSDGAIIAGAVTIADITPARRAALERERLIATIEEERSRMRTVLQQIPAGVLMAEAPSGRLTMWNRQAEQIFGVDFANFTGTDRYSRWQAFHSDGRPVLPHEWPLARALGGEVVRGAEVQYRRPDGSSVWLRIHGAPVTGSEGEILGSIVAFYDIDDERKMRMENARLFEEAKRANQAKDDFFAAVSHELRTPMTSIIGWARLLKMEKLDNDVATEAAESIASSAAVQAQLVDDLLDASRIIAGKIAITPRPLALKPVVDEAVSAALPAARSRGIVLRSTLEDGVRLMADHARLRQIIGNLLSNSIKFTPQGGLIEIISRVENENVCICVRDTGRGISAELLPLVFERGRQKRDGELGGLGLGLTIVSHLAELHGGSVRAESAGEGKGSTFTVTLPRIHS